MKKIIALAGCVALAACSGAEAPAEPDQETMTAQAPAEASMAGTFDVTASDGSTGTTVIDADGNFTSTAADGTVTTGTVARVNDQTCFNSSEEGSAPQCWTDSEPAEDGSWVATSDDGVQVTVSRQEEEAAAE